VNLMSNQEHQTTEISHESTLYAEPIAEIGKFTITNSLITSWVAVIILVTLFVLISKKIKRNPLRQPADRGPKGLQNIFEFLMESALDLGDSVTGERKKTEKFLPIALALFLFVLVNNWLGLLPGVGTIGFIEEKTGQSVFVPFFRGGTADLNTTLAIALIAVVVSHTMGVMAVGAWKYLNKFINLEVLAEIPKNVKKDPAVILINPIKIFVGIVEIIGELAKVASLSFRLFGNVFAGEVLLISMMAIFAFILPLPFMFLEIIVGIIQALIFAMLALVFMTIATSNAEH
jgi:F-type H+-transporting ATPase subunit a